MADNSKLTQQQELFAQNIAKVSTITEDGTIIVSSKGAHWDD